MNYYSDIVFKGFIDGVGEGVLSGGKYDNLLYRMGRKSSGIGFAVNVDLLEDFDKEYRATDVDVLVLYDDKTDVQTLVKKVRALVEEGYAVTAQKTKGKLRFSTLVDLTGGAK